MQDEPRKRADRALVARDYDEVLRILADTVTADLHNRVLYACINAGVRVPGANDLVRHLLTWEESVADPVGEDSWALQEAISAGNTAAARILVENSDVSLLVAIGEYLNEGSTVYPHRIVFERVVETLVYLLGVFGDEDGGWTDEGTYQILLGEYGWDAHSLREAFCEAALRTGLWAPGDECFGPDARYCEQMEIRTEYPGCANYDLFEFVAFMHHSGLVRHLLALRPDYDRERLAAAWLRGAITWEDEITASYRQFGDVLIETGTVVFEALVADAAGLEGVKKAAAVVDEMEVPCFVCRLLSDRGIRLRVDSQT